MEIPHRKQKKMDFYHFFLFFKSWKDIFMVLFGADLPKMANRCIVMVLHPVNGFAKVADNAILPTGLMLSLKTTGI